MSWQIAADLSTDCKEGGMAPKRERERESRLPDTGSSSSFLLLFLLLLLLLLLLTPKSSPLELSSAHLMQWKSLWGNLRARNRSSNWSYLSSPQSADCFGTCKIERLLLPTVPAKHTHTDRCSLVRKNASRDLDNSDKWLRIEWQKSTQRCVSRTQIALIYSTEQARGCFDRMCW